MYYHYYDVDSEMIQVKTAIFESEVMEMAFVLPTCELNELKMKQKSAYVSR